jgi:mono/diheme cytochrome c family protein
MFQDRTILKKSLAALLVGGLFLVGRVHAQDASKGKALFQTNCTSCHAINKVVTGPALAHVEDRWPDKKELHAWIRNNTQVLASGFPYAVNLKKEYSNIAMNVFADFSDKDIDDILAYIKTEQDKQPAAPGGGTPATGAAQSSSGNNSLLFGLMTLVLAVVALILLQVNSNLRKLSDNKEGVRRGEPVPFYRNKAYIALVVIVLFLIGGYYLVQGAIGLGRQQGYQPEQPIFYSHKVHAGVNQISCLYCHSFATTGKHANIPSVNVCMNCHMNINEYTGTAGQLFREDGTEVNGTAEIQKLYSYAGWDAKTRTYTGKGHPVEWIRIHNLPDHVFFSHAQHTNAGKVQCQTCHGPIQQMDEVRQFAPLSMGWCVNCHRTTAVQFKDNGYYSIYERFHKDINDHKIDSVTVQMIGGTECQKCHY